MKNQRIEILSGIGHNNIRATHKSTLEFTKEKSLTKRGDCIVVLNLDKGLIDLNQAFLDLCKSEQCKMTIILTCEGNSETIIGYGHPNLTFQHPFSLVIRKSRFICPRTLMIGANKAAKDLNRDLVSKLRNPLAQVQVKLIAEL